MPEDINKLRPEHDEVIGQMCDRPSASTLAM